MTKIFNKSWILIGFECVLIFSGCSNEKAQIDFPEVFTLNANNITSTQAQLNAEVLSTGQDAIIDYGFYYSESIYSGNFDTISLGTGLITGKYSWICKKNWIENKTYYFAAFVKTAKYTVKGEWISFTWLGKTAPVITSITSKPNITIGDTIFIHGNNFSYNQQNNLIYFNEVTTQPFFSSDTLLKAIIPFLTDDSLSICVEVMGNRATYPQKIKFSPPLLINVTPAMPYPEDTVIVFFNFTPSTNTKVKYNERPLKVTEFGHNYLKFINPTSFDSKEYKVDYFIGNSLFATKAFTLSNPYIEKLSADTIFPGTSISIKGKGFVDSHTTVYFNNIETSYCYSITNNSIVTSSPSPGKYNVLVKTFDCSSNSLPLVVLGTDFTGLSSSEVFPSDTVTLYGNNLIHNQSDKVEIHLYNKNIMEIPSKIVSISKSSVKFVIQDRPANYEIKFIRNNTVFFTGKMIHFKTPTVESISKSQFRIGDTITVKGKYFSKYNTSDYSMSDNYKILSIRDNELKFVLVRCEYGSYPVNIQIGNLSLSLGNIQHLSPYSFGYINMSHATNDNYFANYDNNYFCVNALDSSIIFRFIKKYDASILSIEKFSGNYIKLSRLIIDKWLYYFIQLDSNDVYQYKIDMSNKSITKNQIEMSKKLLNNFITFQLNDEFYIGPDEDYYFWKIKENYSVERVMLMPIRSFNNVNYFVSDNILFLIVDQNVYTYNPDMGEWYHLGNSPGSLANNSLNKEINGSVYFFNNYTYKYVISSNIWQRGILLPFSNFSSITQNDDHFTLTSINDFDYNFATYLNYYPVYDNFITIGK
jgi:hypothetical protein